MFSIHLYWILSFGWITLSLLAIFSGVVPLLHGLTLHGKLRIDVTTHKKQGISLQVKKKFFSYFYLFGAIFNGFSLWLCTTSNYRNDVLRIVHTPLFGTSRTGQLELNARTIVCLVILEAHLIRRTLESFFVTQFGNSTMHASALILGIGHYLLVTLSIIADPDAIFMDRLMQPVNLIVLASGFLLFIYSSYHQHQCNNILAEIKRSNDFQYAIPQGDWFEFVICPHYAAEILLYFSFVMMTSGRNYTIWIIFIWVSINQSISAKMTSDWYQNKFRDCGPVARYKLVPFIW